MAGILNVLDFGAKGNGAHDDAPAFQIALNAAAGAPTAAPDGTERRVYVPTGLYLINSQVVVPPSVVLFGDGARATKIQCGSSFPASTAMFRIGNGSGYAL